MRYFLQKSPLSSGSFLKIGCLIFMIIFAKRKSLSVFENSCWRCMRVSERESEEGRARKEGRRSRERA